MADKLRGEAENVDKKSRGRRNLNLSPMLGSGLGPCSSSSSAPVQPSGSRANQGRPCGGLASVARLVKLGRCKNVVVVAGAGISTASGIPDFRSAAGGFFFFFCFSKLP